MSDTLSDFQIAILEEAWDFLQRDNLNLAVKLEAEVKAGKTPEQLSRTYAGVAGEHRAAYAKRIENAARYLHALKA